MEGFVPLETQKRGKIRILGQVGFCERKENEEKNGSERDGGGGATAAWR
jgi:hypothetical protein